MNASNLYYFKGKYYSHHPDEVIDWRWRLITPLGFGGMSEVWKAENRKSKATVVLKLCATMDSEDRHPLDSNMLFNYQGRFKQECAILRELNEKRTSHIITRLEDGLHGRGTEEAYFWLAIQHYDQSQSFEFMDAEETFKNFTIQDRLIRLRKVAIAIDEMHEYRVLHCDIKPANILVNQFTTDTYLSDFGLATWMDPNRSSFSRAMQFDSPEIARMRFNTERYSSIGRRERTTANKTDDLYAFVLTVIEILCDGKMLLDKSTEPGSPKDRFTRADPTWDQFPSIILAPAIKRPNSRNWAKQLDSLFAGALEDLKNADNVSTLAPMYQNAHNFIEELFRIFKVSLDADGPTRSVSTPLPEDQSNPFVSKPTAPNPLSEVFKEVASGPVDTGAVREKIKETYEKTSPLMRHPMMMVAAVVVVVFLLGLFLTGVLGAAPSPISGSTVLPTATTLAVRTSTPDGANGLVVMASSTDVPEATPIPPTDSPAETLIPTDVLTLEPTLTVCQQADFDGNGQVDEADEDLLTTGFSNSTVTPEPRLDLNRDQRVDVRDMALMGDCLPTPTPTAIPPTTVPEPTAIPTADRCALFDLNSNGILDQDDETVFDLFIAQDIAYDPLYDLNHDGAITVADLFVFEGFLGQPC